MFFFNFKVKMNALHLLGTGLSAFTLNDRSAAHDIVALVGRYTLSSDPRVRSAAFEALLVIIYTYNLYVSRKDIFNFGATVNVLNPENAKIWTDDSSDFRQI